MCLSNPIRDGMPMSHKYTLGLDYGTEAVLAVRWAKRLGMSGGIPVAAGIIDTQLKKFRLIRRRNLC